VPDPDLAKVAQSWSKLSSAIKRAILALIASGE
jgi:hypothetical protein